LGGLSKNSHLGGLSKNSHLGKLLFGSIIKFLTL
jgi:hypothetical protein